MRRSCALGNRCPLHEHLPLPPLPSLAQAYVADGLATANSTIGSVARAEADVADIRQRVEDLNLEQLQPGTLAVSASSWGWWR